MGKKENSKMIKMYGYQKYILLLFFLILSLKASAPDLNYRAILVSVSINPFEKLVDAIVKVESSGDNYAFNCEEEAIGAFQIRPIRLEDYNQRTGKNYDEKDLYNYEISKEIFLYYANKFSFNDYESIARNWNGSGKLTLEYWAKVKSNLELSGYQSK